MMHESPFTTRDNWMFGLALICAAILVASVGSIFYVIHSLFGGAS